MSSLVFLECGNKERNRKVNSKKKMLEDFYRQRYDPCLKVTGCILVSVFLSVAKVLEPTWFSFTVKLAIDQGKVLGRVNPLF